MENVATSYPLDWPIGYKRTTNRQRGLFKQTPDRAQSFLRNELFKLRASHIVISSNSPLRQDGQMYSDAMRRTKHFIEPGVAVYFKYKGRDLVLCCDQYDAIWKNVYAIGLTIEAIRSMERWGVSDFLDRAFTGFTKLLTTPYRDPWKILGIREGAGISEIDAAYFEKSKTAHPDAGGSNEQMQDLNWAREEAKRIFNN